MSDEKGLREKIVAQLQMVQDPQLKRDIVSLGMLKDIEITQGEVTIHIEMTAPSDALKESLRDEINEKLSSLEQIEKCQVEFRRAQRQGTSAVEKPAIPGIKHVIAVASGKGGVGKSTAAVNLALAIRGQGYKVGLMDGDIYGPNVPQMLGIPTDKRPQITKEEKMESIEAHGIKVISMGVLVPADQPMVWRGPMLHSTISQFLQKVDWGELDYLLIDLPPGTGDVQLSLVQLVPLSGAVIVTTPQEVSLLDVRKGIMMFRKTNVPILGIIENMTGEIFGHGGGSEAAKQFDVPFLGEVPLDKAVREAGDSGIPIVLAQPDSVCSQAFIQAAQKVINKMSEPAIQAG